MNIAYQEGSTALAVDAADFKVYISVQETTGESAASANARCAYTHIIYYRTLVTDELVIKFAKP